MSKREDIERINLIRGKRKLVLDALDNDLDECVYDYLTQHITRDILDSPKEFMDEFDKYLDEVVDAHDKLCEIVQDYYNEKLYGSEEDEED